jgi:hypothetical protein
MLTNLINPSDFLLNFLGWAAFLCIVTFPFVLHFVIMGERVPNDAILWIPFFSALCALYILFDYSNGQFAIEAEFQNSVDIPSIVQEQKIRHLRKSFLVFDTVWTKITDSQKIVELRTTSLINEHVFKRGEPMILERSALNNYRLKGRHAVDDVFVKNYLYCGWIFGIIIAVTGYFLMRYCIDYVSEFKLQD